MAQKKAWEREYKNPQLLQLGDEPRQDLKNYLGFLKKVEGVVVENLDILDLGSGTGRHANFLASLGNHVTGLEISSVAIELARKHAKELGVVVDYRLANVGDKYPFENESYDLVLDIMTTNSLDETERGVYLEEVSRVLRPGGHFFVRALCKDGDKNAKNLIKLSPGPECDTYINKEMDLVERVFSQADFVETYSKYFTIQELIKKSNYAQFGGQSYKRNYWLGYMKKN